MRLLVVILAFGVLSCNHIDEVSNAEKSITHKGIENDIIVLAADSMEGRAPFTPGEKRTIDYIVSRMKKIGLEPVFNGDYLQPVPLVGIVSEPSNELTIQLSGGSMKMNRGDDYSIWNPSLVSKLSVINSDLVFVGYGINAPELGWNDFGEMDLSEKTIVVLVNDPGFHSRNDSLFKGRSMTYFGRWRYKFEEAERQGARGCIIVHEDEAAGYPWSVVNRSVDQADFFLVNEKLTDRKCLVNGWLTHKAAIQLFAKCNMDYEEMKRLASEPGFKAIPMGANYSLDIENSWEKSVSYNIGGFIQGSERSDEAIVYTAHWDHLGIGTSVDGDSIYNGASDNAAAVAWMLSIAEAFRTLENNQKRSILFLSPTAEEAGMLGSQYYVENPKFDHQKTVACFNSDVIMFLGAFNDVTVTGLGHSELDGMLEKEAAKQGRYICNDPNPENGMFYRSDQLPFLKAGIPALFAKGYSDQVEMGREKTLAAIEEYWKKTYHKPSDEYKPEQHNLQGLVDDTKLFFRLGYKLANSSDFPKWNIESEFYSER